MGHPWPARASPRLGCPPRIPGKGWWRWPDSLGWTSPAAVVADGESRVVVGAEHNPPGGWRKQSPQLSVEEGGDSAGAGESSAFKAVPPWRTPTPPALAWPLLGQALASPPLAAVWPQSAGGGACGTGGLQARQEVVQGSAPRPLVCTRRSPAARSSPWDPKAAHLGKGEGVGAATLAEAKWPGSGEGRSCPGQGHLALVKKRVLRVRVRSTRT